MTGPNDRPGEEGRVPPARIIALFLLALAVRVGLAVREDVIPTDGPMYLSQAKAFLTAPLGEALPRAGRSPLLVLLIAAVARLGVPLAAAGYGVVCLFGALVVFPLHSLARTLFDARVAWMTALVYAFVPVPARLSSTIYTTGPALFFTVAAVALAARLVVRGSIAGALAAGLACALAYAARSDALVVVAFAAAGASVSSGAGARRRAAFVALVLLPAVGAVFLLDWAASSPGQAPITGKLSEEQWTRFLDVSLPTRYVLEHVWEDLPESMFIPFAAFALFGMLAPALGESRRLRVALLVLCAVWLFFLLRSAQTSGALSKRHTTLVAVLLLPWTGRGLLLLARGVPERALARVAVAIGMVACLACLPKLWKTHQGERLVEKAAGEALRGLPEPRGPVLCIGTIASYYAGVESCPADWALLPSEEAFRRMREAEVRYVVADRALFQYAPKLAAALAPPDATLVAEVRVEGCSTTVPIFRVEPAR